MIRYRRCFQVDISHDYFLSRGEVVWEAQNDTMRAALTREHSVGRYLEIFPDAATEATLRGHRMLFRVTETGFLVAVRLDESAPDIRPAVAPGPEFALTFALRLRDARFANYTELGPVGDGFHLFGNDSANRVAGVNYLSRPVPAFDPARRYEAGEIRAEASGTTFDLFVALRDTGPAAAPVAADWRRIPADTFDATATYQLGDVVLAGNRLFRALVNGPGSNLNNAADWQPAGTLGNQYAGAADLATAAGSLFDLDVSAAALAQCTVRVFRGAQIVPASEQHFSVASGTLTHVQLDLRGLAPGPCRLEVLDGVLAPVASLARTVYLSTAALAQGWFGAIHIGPGVADFALFNANGTLRTPAYALRFLNRATRWRYIFPAAQSLGAGAEVALEGGSDRRMVTAVPRALTRFGGGVRLQADDTTTTASEEVLLPPPEPHRIRRQNAEWFSETHLPNLTVGP
ncbi:MAG TPA: hypothetical protein VM146_07045 [Steroidobacteraceae bacterium]|nr:hypothetical protein [Steroidobacteraceae bacterium]